jgi:anti-sigma factor RsiW
VSCLGERLTALVDGELGHEERDRALAHLAGCARCRAEADGLRRLKRRLRGLSDLPPADGADDLPSGDFLARLRDLGRTAGTPRGAVPRPPFEPPQGSPSLLPVGGRPPAPPGPPGSVRRQPRRRYLAVGAATLFFGFGAASYVAGGEEDTPTVNPAFDRFTVEHALTSGDVPLTDPLTDQTVQTSPGP